MHHDYDQLLAIKTGNTFIQSDQSVKYYPYEATPYSILHTLFEQYTLNKADCFVDFGCGKGRLLFYVHYFFGSTVTGIEMNQYLYDKAIKNKSSYLRKKDLDDHSIFLTCTLAEKYRVKKADNVFYFFNPFSGTIFQKVIENIVKSVWTYPRIVDVILYYPLDDYINYLEEQTAFECFKEVKVPGLHRINNNERFLIYRLNKR